MIKVSIKILLLSLLFFSYSFAQEELHQQFNFAKQLYEQENYFDAVTELKRLLFFDTSHRYTFEANMLMGQSYKKGVLFNDAANCFNLAERYSRTDEEKYTASIEAVRVNILRRTTEQALKIIDRLETSGKYKQKQDELYYWKGWVYIFDSDFKKAAGEFEKISMEHELRLLSMNTYDEQYSESLAKILSIFLPGAGQFYTGNYLNGVISLAWNVFAGYLTINSFVDDRIFDGIITGNLLWLRFYVGGIQNAEEFAKERNTEIINNKLFYLQNEYKGLKP
jgi:hypothetical protein